MRPLRLIPVLGLLVCSPAFAQGMDHGAMPGMSGTSMTQGGSDLNALSGPAFDRAFLSMMTVHHQGAVQMSQSALKSVRDPQVKAWAQAIVRAQDAEIARMQGWLKGLGGVDRAAQMGMQQDLSAMMAKMGQRPTDRAFLTAMLPHHASAVSMATVALQRSSDPRVLGLAREIVRAQAGEMYDFRRWLLGHPH